MVILRSMPDKPRVIRTPVCAIYVVEIIIFICNGYDVRLDSPPAQGGVLTSPSQRNAGTRYGALRCSGSGLRRGMNGRSQAWI